MLIRPTKLSDTKPLMDMLQTSGQFDHESLEHVLETLNAHFAEKSEGFWFSADQEGLMGAAYCAPEVMTKGTWNLLMLWVDPTYARHGVGQALISHIEKNLNNKQARLLLVETSSLDEFVAARAFYSKQGFIEDARIRNYYAQGEDKLIYTKAL